MCLRHRQQRGDFPGSAGLTKYGDVVRVATEAQNVSLDPFQRQQNVQHAKVDGILGFVVGIGKVQKTQRAQSMVNADENNVTSSAKVGSVIH